MEANRSSLWAGANLRAIFVSYRRLDTEGESGRLFDDLVSRFGERSVHGRGRDRGGPRFPQSH